MKKNLVLITLLYALQAQSQLRNVWDNIRYDLHQDKSWFVCLDGKNSVIRDLRLKLFGMQTGYTFNGRTNLYLGYYTSYNKERVIIENPTATSASSDSNTVFARYHLSYLNLGLEYYFVNSKKWRLSVPIGFGIGSGRDDKFKIRGGKENIFEHSKHLVLPVDIGFYVNYKIRWWVWAGAGLGSRFSVGASEYSGSYYTFGVSLRFGEMYNRFMAWYREKTFDH